MGKHEKKAEKRTPPPVVTGRDKRAEQRDDSNGHKQPSDAPDGVSGNWS